MGGGNNNSVMSLLLCEAKILLSFGRAPLARFDDEDERRAVYKTMCVTSLCPVCLSYFGPGCRMVVVCVNKHFLCGPCYTRWTEVGNYTCPLCRGDYLLE